MKRPLPHSAMVNVDLGSMTGIQRAVEMKKARKREEKISMMEESMYRAEVRADMREMMHEMPRLRR